MWVAVNLTIFLIISLKGFKMLSNVFLKVLVARLQVLASIFRAFRGSSWHKYLSVCTVLAMRGFQPVWTQCGLLSPQSLANFAEIRFRSAIVPE
jgi:hypothetical protein